MELTEVSFVIWFIFLFTLLIVELIKWWKVSNGR